MEVTSPGPTLLCAYPMPGTWHSAGTQPTQHPARPTVSAHFTGEDSKVKSLGPHVPLTPGSVSHHHWHSNFQGGLLRGAMFRGGRFLHGPTAQPPHRRAEMMGTCHVNDSPNANTSPRAEHEPQTRTGQAGSLHCTLPTRGFRHCPQWHPRAGLGRHCEDKGAVNLNHPVRLRPGSPPLLEILFVADNSQPERKWTARQRDSLLVSTGL